MQEIFTVPKDTAVTRPVALPTVVAADDDVHTPPDAVSERLAVLPLQAPSGPVMLPAPGVGFTVRALVAAGLQPVL